MESDNDKILDRVIFYRKSTGEILCWSDSGGSLGRVTSEKYLEIRSAAIGI